MNKLLVVLPFNPQTGVSGRKAGAIESSIESLRLSNFIVDSVSLEPEELSLSPVYKYFTIIEKYIAILLKKTPSIFGRVQKRIVNLIWREIVFHASGRYLLNNQSTLFAYSMYASPSLFSLRCKERYGTEYYINEHRTTYRRQFQKITDIPVRQLLALNEAKKIIALTSVQAAAIFDVSKVKATYCPLPVFIPPLKCVKKESDRLIIGAWTNWRKIKRIDFLVEAFIVAVNKMNFTGDMVIAGPIPEQDMKEKVKEMIERSGLSSRIIFLGGLRGDSLDDFINGVDVCAIPSKHESFGLPVIEAWARGKPVVVTKCGGPESMVTQDYLGKIVELNDVNAFALSLVCVLNNLDEYPRGKIHAHVQKEYSINGVASKLSKQLV